MRHPLRLAVAATVVVASLWLLGGVAVSQLIGETLLKPRPPRHGADVWAVAADEDAVVLDGRDRAGLTHPGHVGLWWEGGGYLQLGPVGASEGSTVTRPILRGGPLPPLCGEDACPRLDIDFYAVRRDPGELGLAFEEVTVPSPVGGLDAWLVPPAEDEGDREGATWALHVHGSNADRREAVRLLPAFADAGLTSLVLSYRNDPGAPSDPSGRRHLGLTEHADLRAAAAEARRRGAERLVLVGHSTGAAIVMAYLERHGADDVVAVVFDAPSLDPRRVVAHAAPAWVPRPVTALGEMLAAWRYALDWEALAFVDRAAEVLTVPALVFHGADDPLVPPSGSRELAAARPDLVDLHVVEGARHGLSWNADPVRYEQILTAFLERVA